MTHIRSASGFSFFGNWVGPGKCVLGTSNTAILLIDHWMADYNWDSREFELALDTTGFAPGFYDLRLFFCDSSTETLRIELLPADV